MNKFIKPLYKTAIHKSYRLQLPPKDLCIQRETDHFPSTCWKVMRVHVFPESDLGTFDTWNTALGYKTPQRTKTVSQNNLDHHTVLQYAISFSITFLFVVNPMDNLNFRHFIIYYGL